MASAINSRDSISNSRPATRWVKTA